MADRPIAEWRAAARAEMLEHARFLAAEGRAAETLVGSQSSAHMAELYRRAADVFAADATEPHHDKPEEPALADKIVAHVRDWVERSAELVRDTGDDAELKLFLLNPGGDDDGTLVLQWRFQETVNGPRYDEQSEGRVEGVKFR